MVDGEYRSDVRLSHHPRGIGTGLHLSFSGRLRSEFLNETPFMSLREATEQISNRVA